MANARRITEINWDPITRIVGSLGLYTKIDLENREVVECRSTSSIFRGYSVFMKGKDPRDAHFITSRICGICGDNHATCSMYAQNMAFGIAPPHMAEWIVNLGEAAEYMFDHNLFQDNMAGVDYCEQIMKETNPAVFAAAQTTLAPHSAIHGFRTIADIMSASESFHRSLVSRSAPNEPPHPRDVLSHGRPSRSPIHALSWRCRHCSFNPDFTDYLVRLMKYIEFVKRGSPTP